ncbi:MAG: response regulator [Magnetococcus sp. DMHC-8]
MAHILVVDDDEVMRAFLAAILRHVGHAVLEADNGESGLATLAAAPVDLLITDIFMPEMDGLDLLTTVLRRHPGCKIIAISGGYKAMNPQLSLTMARGLGAVDVIAKPFQTATVVRTVARVLQSTHIPNHSEAEG